MKKTSLLANILPTEWIIVLVAFGLPLVLVPLMMGRLVYVVAREGVTA